ncbi:MAG TPA: AAA family ATPase, partial [Candidatus Avacidaminococcus intestinavium]|nr:AAA family ATPase [Candidatus Avacidaminococcus intestinavium]
MKQGDIVIVSDGNYKFRAIGEVVDECQFQYVEEQGAFYQTRPIEWLRVFETSLPVDYILDNHFSQSPLYRLADSNLKKETFRKLIESSKKGVVSQKNYVLIIDEINRGNIANIFGELITLIEQTKRSGEKEAQSTTLPYSKERFSIPNNLYLIGTMNTSDRSLTSLDIALRRRFKFIELLPKYSLLNNIKVYGVHLSEILK